MTKLRRAITAIVLLITAVLSLIELFRVGQHTFFSLRAGYYKTYMSFVIGIILSIILNKTLLKKNLDLLQTMSHEGAHLLVGDLFLHRKITKFNATSKGDGEINFEGNNNIFMSLAPYSFPYLCFIVLLIRVMIKPEYLPVIDALLGIVLGFHISCFIAQTHRQQSDLLNHGLFISTLFIITFLSFFISIIIYSIDYQETGDTIETVNLWQANIQYFNQSVSDINLGINKLIILLKN